MKKYIPGFIALLIFISVVVSSCALEYPYERAYNHNYHDREYRHHEQDYRGHENRDRDKYNRDHDRYHHDHERNNRDDD